MKTKNQTNIYYQGDDDNEAVCALTSRVDFVHTAGANPIKIKPNNVYSPHSLMVFCFNLEQ